LDDPRRIDEAITHINRAMAEENDNPLGWRLLAEAYDRKGEPGMARLAAAEQNFALGQMQQARIFAQRARDILPASTPQYRRATDIILASNPSNQDLREMNEDHSPREPTEPGQAPPLPTTGGPAPSAPRAPTAPTTPAPATPAPATTQTTTPAEHRPPPLS
jgi:hypothetical protein